MLESISDVEVKLLSEKNVVRLTWVMPVANLQFVWKGKMEVHLSCKPAIELANPHMLIPLPGKQESGGLEAQISTPLVSPIQFSVTGTKGVTHDKAAYRAGATMATDKGRIYVLDFDFTDVQLKMDVPRIFTVEWEIADTNWQNQPYELQGFIGLTQNGQFHSAKKSSILPLKELVSSNDEIQLPPILVARKFNSTKNSPDIPNNFIVRPENNVFYSSSEYKPNIFHFRFKIENFDTSKLGQLISEIQKFGVITEVKYEQE